MAEEQLRIEERLEELEDNPPRYVSGSHGSVDKITATQQV